jgi:hypothetical protein
MTRCLVLRQLVANIAFLSTLPYAVLSAQALECSSLKDDQARLDCYDNAGSSLCSSRFESARIDQWQITKWYNGCVSVRTPETLSLSVHSTNVLPREFLSERISEDYETLSISCSNALQSDGRHRWRVNFTHLSDLTSPLSYAGFMREFCKANADLEGCSESKLPAIWFGWSFDDEEVRTSVVRRMELVSPPEGFVKDLIGAQTLRVQAREEGGGQAEITFNVKGFEDVAQDLISLCRSN